MKTICLLLSLAVGAYCQSTCLDVTQQAQEDYPQCFGLGSNPITDPTQLCDDCCTAVADVTAACSTQAAADQYKEACELASTCGGPSGGGGGGSGAAFNVIAASTVMVLAKFAYALA